MLNLSDMFMRGILSWRMILDILIMGVGLFLIYRTMRRLGTWRILAGFMIAIVFFVVASLLSLKGIVWIYSNLSQVAVVALIVIFQPELRKIFERFVSLGQRKAGREGQDLSLLISEAVFNLARERRGAILVFPGKEPITERLSGGVAVNADLSHALIMSIFDPHSPGHDGAIVVENGRASSFGVRLPLSETKALSEDFGTRHHAAMGLSELSDALVVVVSEERGSVSTFYGGKTKQVHEQKALDSRIASHWRSTTSYPFLTLKGREKWAFVPELGVCLLLASLFWFAVIFAQTERLERVVSVPVEYVATPENIALVGNKPTEVRLHLAGPKSDLDAINLTRPAVKIDLSKVKPGEQEFVITEKDLHLPKAIRLLDTEPSTLLLTFREIHYREIIVDAQLVGKLPGDLQIASVTVSPQKVWILSPENEKEEREDKVMTTPIYLESIKENTKLICKIVAPAALQPAGKRWPDVEVMITVEHPSSDK